MKTDLRAMTSTNGFEVSLAPEMSGMRLGISTSNTHPDSSTSEATLVFPGAFQCANKNVLKTELEHSAAGWLTLLLPHPPSIQSIIPSINQSHNNQSQTNIYTIVYMNIFMHVAKCNHHFATFCGSC